MDVREPSRKQLWFWWLVLIAIIIVGVVIAAHVSLPKSVETSQPGLYSINRFIDGDTIDVNMNGSVETIRMIGMDTPETHKPNTPVQCYGPEAANYTKNLIDGQKVRLQADPLDTNRDRYGRLLRYVYLADGRLVEKELISNGYAFAYTQFPFIKTSEFKAYEVAAKTSNKGLWASCQVTVESNGREQTNAAQ